MDQHQLDIVQAHPLGAHLDPSRTSLNAIVQDPVELDTVNREDLQPIALALFSTFLNHPASRLLSSPTGQSNLGIDILRVISTIYSNTVHFDQLKPLLRAVLNNQPDVEI
ncbi:hypothetical protein F4803DRAFT_281050 [Xylaria telfairii]|nr:hypothetical protein F4803DRAFT_281050 [Xylaria telfairii]